MADVVRVGYAQIAHHHHVVFGKVGRTDVSERDGFQLHLLLHLPLSGLGIFSLIDISCQKLYRSRPYCLISSTLVFWGFNTAVMIATLNVGI